jgi:glutamine synthetase
MVAGGHYGLLRKIAPPPCAEGNAAYDKGAARLPASLPEATELFRNSEIVKDYFGSAFVEHYAASRDIEWHHWTEWQAAQVTSYELKRYFRTI